MCMSFGARAQTPTYRLAGADSLYRFDFSTPEIVQPELISGQHEPLYIESSYVGELRTVDVYSGDKLLFYERNDTFFNAAGTAIFTLYAKTRWREPDNRRQFLGRTNQESWAFDGLSDFEHYVVRNEHSRTTDIIFRFGNNAVVHKYTLPDDASRWMTDTELKHDSIDGLWMRDITATRTADGLGTWLLGSNNEYIFVLRLQNDKLTLEHRYDSLPGGWGGMELYSTIAINNAGTQLAVGSYSIINPQGYLAQNTRLSTYSFDRQTGLLSFDTILRDVVLDEYAGNSLEDGGVDDYSPSNPHKYFEQEQYLLLPYDINGFYGSIFIHLCYTADDSIIYVSHAGAPFGVDIPSSSLNRNTNTYTHSNVMAVNVNTGKHLLVELEQFVGYQIMLQANGQIWIHVNHGAEPDWYIVKYPEEVFERGSIEVLAYNWPIPQENVHHIITFNRGLYAYKKLDVAAVDSCMAEPQLLITADTSYFDSFRVEQGASSIVFSKEQLIEGDFRISCPSFTYGKFPVTLYGIKNGTVAQTKTRRVLISENYRQPIASFEIKDTVGCQWINYEFVNTSIIFPKNSDVEYYWSFGNGRDTSISIASGFPSSSASVTTSYTSSGKYPISMVVDDGYCADTFSIEDSITILDAPRPGILISDTQGCEPLAVEVHNKYISETDSIIYYWGDASSALVSCLPNCGSEKNIYTLSSDKSKEQRFELIQELYGPTGCVTYDMASVLVYASFLPTDTPYLSLVTISPEQSTLISWDSLDHASYYNVYKNNVRIDTQTALVLELLDISLSKKVNTYIISGVNVCEQESNRSNIGQNIVLSGERNEDNTESYLNWNEYQDWQNDVYSYHLESIGSNGLYSSVSSDFLPLITSYIDKEFLLLDNLNEVDYLTFDKCYRLSAEEKYTGVKSYSNTLCIPYKPVLIMPNAFSPNSDGLNDHYKALTLGYTSMKLEVYNRWGEKVFEGISWDGIISGLPAPLGVYSVLFSGVTNEGKREYQALTVSLVR